MVFSIRQPVWLSRSPLLCNLYTKFDRRFPPVVGGDKQCNSRRFHNGQHVRIWGDKCAIIAQNCFTSPSPTEADPYASLNPLAVETVQKGYFAVDNGKPKDSSEGRATKADDEAYNLIMCDKERLLSMTEPLRFIFSHSALREGWDNPNVFQICTLREISTERERRQTIGRGLRLPVRENGERCFDPLINRLTVVASESFKEFAKKLQDEMQKECGVNFENRILNKRERRKGILKKQRLLDPDFQNLWDKTKRKTRYAVKFSTADLVSRCAGELREMPEIKSPFIRREKHELFMTLKEGVFGQERSAQTIRAPEYRAPIPDLLGHLQRETELTRPTLAEILHKSDRLGEVTHNPQQFLEHAVTAIQKSLHDLMVQGIEYERIADAEWEMHRLEVEELESWQLMTQAACSAVRRAGNWPSRFRKRCCSSLTLHLLASRSRCSMRPPDHATAHADAPRTKVRPQPQLRP